ncbi:MAG TPA: TolC family protein [Caulobacteraceae bacterium]|jgi:outer membrane protein TolC|nr:TolC family protein [Caulobacteraceae bacterium]
MKSGPSVTATPRLARGRRLGAIAALMSLAACAGYHPRPLPTAPDIQPAAAALSVDVANLRLEPLKTIVIDPRAGFTPLDVAVLAALNNPDLRAKRDSLGVPAAQVFAAGLLPDPQISTGVDQPIAGPDTHTAFNISPSLDIAGLLAVADNERAARFTAKQANLDVLWAEWTTAQQARQLAETALTDEARAAFLGEILKAAADRADRSGKALQRGDVTGQTASADLAAKLDIETQLATAEHDAEKARRELNALLGLDAAVHLPLVRGAPAEGVEAGHLQRDLASLPARRPDLLALQAGYAAQDVNLRKTILSQFPLASIAFAYARDPTPTTTLGIAAVLALPIFNGHRGDVKVQEATREQLRAEYQARLDQADADVKSAAAELASANAQAAVLEADLPRLEAMLGPAPAAFARGDLDSQAYLALVQTVVAKQADLEDRELTARMAQIQLETTLFIPPAEAGGAG